MLSDKRVRNRLQAGYTFMFKGQHCTILRAYTRYFEYSTIEKPSGNYMYYDFFQTIPHFKSKWKESTQKRMDFNPGFLPLVDRIVKNVQEKKSPNYKIYIK